MYFRQGASRHGTRCSGLLSGVLWWLRSVPRRIWPSACSRSRWPDWRWVWWQRGRWLSRGKGRCGRTFRRESASLPMYWRRRSKRARTGPSASPASGRNLTSDLGCEGVRFRPHLAPVGAGGPGSAWTRLQSCVALRREDKDDAGLGRLLDMLRS